MIKLTKEELSRYRPLNNMVLITPIEDRSKVKLTEECTLELDTDFTANMIDYANVCNRVVAVPDKLTFGGGKMEWVTEQELSVDDIVVVQYTSVVFAERNSDFIWCEGVKYFYVSYRDIYMKVKKYKPFTNWDDTIDWNLTGKIGLRDSDNNIIGFSTLIPLNGYLLCQPMTVVNYNKYLPFYKEKPNKQAAIVRYMGSVNSKHLERYKPESQSDYAPMDCMCSIGDIVYFPKYRSRDLEGKINNVLGNLQPIKRSDVYFVETPTV